jgi:hypothetical protein
MLDPDPHPYQMNTDPQLCQKRPFCNCDVPIKTILVQNNPNKNIPYFRHYSRGLHGTYPPAHCLQAVENHNSYAPKGGGLDNHNSNATILTYHDIKLQTSIKIPYHTPGRRTLH